MDDMDLVLHTRNGLGAEYKEVLTTLHTRETTLTFDELCDTLIDYETCLQCDDNSSKVT